MTWTKKTEWLSDQSRDKIPDGWKLERRGSVGYRATHQGHAMNRCQWIKNVYWRVDTDEKKRTTKVYCYSPGEFQDVQKQITIVGDSLTVEKGPWEILRRPGETPLMAGIRWVQEQENAAKQYGSR